ncbi:hypothetical protein EWM64_g9087 [Hericium alpestre]|uniref:Uncharacterized protein n=1 Tax=Hericium alpestre TaxID=135208 RepID=A0A4Y9ZKE2_9AGAM|nr:hypothetical protein EWM64_g9087 [Hericium alpestre]
MSNDPAVSSPFPPLTRKDVMSFQFSAWYPIFSSISIKSTIIRPLSIEFRSYLDAESVFLPEGSEDVPAASTVEDVDEEADEESDHPHFAFPALDAQIRAVVKEYDAVFPKLNFSSPKDAAWILPSFSPLKCTSPADVYLVLKSSDFVTHDLRESNIFENCINLPNQEDGDSSEYQLELILRKWYSMEGSRELRCFVRDNNLIALSQRDNNHYDFLNETATQMKIISSVRSYWESQVKPKWTSTSSYTFDILLTRDLERFHVLDFNPYAPRTDALLFTYEELQGLLPSSESPAETLPVLRVIDSAAHPAAARNAPTHQHNMVPLEALTLSSGRGMEEFAAVWQEQLRHSMQEDGDSD